MRRKAYKNPVLSPRKKNVKKALRCIVQYLILITCLYFIINTLFFPKEYQAYEGERSGTLDTGFIALSYFGVDRGERSSLIDTKRLEEHLGALVRSGYVAITQQDILDYYRQGIPLPEKSVFLMFEDGRRDTAIFAQPIMERLNLKGTALTYAKNLYEYDPKFLSPADMKSLYKTTYWEHGTNGFRLAFINVFGKEGEFFDVLTSLEYQELLEDIQVYNHYLMDYIRDEKGIPRESLEQMEARVRSDYELLRKVYTDAIGEVPALYTIMHSNTGRFGTNEKTSMVNADEIYSTFALHFNREGDCQNVPESSIYDLTRLQPQPYWYANHLLTHVLDDSGKGVRFVTGDEARAVDWSVLTGVAEFQGESIVLTSPARSTGLMKSAHVFPADIILHVTLAGQKAGEQAIYLRADEARDSYTGIRLLNNVLCVVEKEGDQRQEKELYRLDLSVLIGEKETNQETLKLSEPGLRELTLTLRGESLTVKLDGHGLGTYTTAVGTDGHIYLESCYFGYPENNDCMEDQVYDGVFVDLAVKSPYDGMVYYDDRLAGWEAFRMAAINIFRAIVNWFIKTL